LAILSLWIQEAISEYNIAEYNIGEYSSGIVIDDAYVSVGGQGKIIQMGFEAEVFWFSF